MTKSTTFPPSKGGVKAPKTTPAVSTVGVFTGENTGPIAPKSAVEAANKAKKKPFPVMLVYRDSRGCQQYPFFSYGEFVDWASRKQYRNECLTAIFIGKDRRESTRLRGTVEIIIGKIAYLVAKLAFEDLKGGAS